jgi:hypothetical protein
MTNTSDHSSWPTKRDAFELGLMLGRLLAMTQQKTPTTTGLGAMIQGLPKRIKALFEGYEIASKLWALRRPAGLIALIASWWEQVLWLLQLLLRYALG